MAGPKERKKLTKPGLDYKIQKALTKFANKQSKIGVGFMSMGEYLATGPGRADAIKIIAKYEKQAGKIIKGRKESLTKARVKSIKKQKQKKKD